MYEPSSYGNGENAVAAKPAQSSTVSTSTRTSAPVTLTDAHEMFIAIAVMAGFVMVATLIAGIDQSTAHAMLGLMLLLLLLQGVSHVNPFVSWVAAHPLQPKGSMS